MSIKIEKYIFDAEKFYKNASNSLLRRYKSWDICYKAFSEAHNKGNLNDEDYYLLALHLSFYLASFGMYRGSSFLLETNYEANYPIVKEIMKEGYKKLWGINCEDLKDDENIGKLFELKANLEEIYIEIVKTLKKKIPNSKNYSENSISPILLSKVLMGTMGCVPAFDTNFNEGYKKKFKKESKFDDETIKSLCKFYSKHIDDLKKQRENINKASTVEYPQMKILDMGFFDIGEKEKQKDENQIKIITKKINKYADKNNKDEVVKNSDIKKIIGFDCSPNILLSDLCYNKYNKGFNGELKGPFLFEWIKKGKYKILGEGYPYTGDVYHKRKDGTKSVWGHWDNGILVWHK